MNKPRLAPAAVSWTAAAFLLIVAPAIGAGRLDLNVADTLPTTDKARAGRAADLNGDNRPDLLAIGAATGYLHVAMATGDRGDFDAVQAYSIQNVAERGKDWGPEDLDLADMNGDGRLDAVVSCRTKGCISILPGIDATGRFGDATIINTTGGPVSAQLVDLNNDNRMDIVYADASRNGIGVLIQQTNRTFGTPVILPAGTETRDVTVADLNGDNIRDIVACNRGDNSVTIYYGQAGGTAFSFGATLTGGSMVRPRAVVINDFNGDGRADIAVGNEGFPVVSFFYANAGTGTFTAGTPVTMFAGCTGMVMRDMNGDNRPDLVFSLLSQPYFQILYSTFTPGTFTVGPTIFAGPFPMGISTSDVDNDGRPDVLVSLDRSNHILVVRATDALGNFAVPTFQPMNSTFASTAVTADFTGDGRVDLVYGGATTSTVFVFPSTATAGVFGNRISVPVPARPDALAVGDINRDGLPDLLGVNASSARAFVLLGNTSGSATLFRTPTTINTAANPVALAVADFDGDGRLDLATAHQIANWVSVRLGNGQATLFNSPTNYPLTSGGNPSSLAAGDFDGDSRPDLLVGRTGVNRITVMRTNESTGFTVFDEYTLEAGTLGVAVGDINRDSLPDILVSHADTNRMSLLVASQANRGRFVAPVLYSTGLAPRALRVADINGDGNQDVITVDNSSDSITFLEGLPLQPYFKSPTRRLGVPDQPGSAVFVDADRDGKLDIAVASVDALSAGVIWNRDEPETESVSCEVQHACYVERQYEDFWNQSTNRSTINTNATALCAGTKTRGALAAEVQANDLFTNYIGFVLRAYIAIFNDNSTITFSATDFRIPDISGTNYWTGVLRSFPTLSAGQQQVVLGFTSSAEWVQRVGNRDNPGFVDFLYTNILGRTPDPVGKAFHVGNLDNNRITRSELILQFLNAPEAVDKYKNHVMVAAGFLIMNRQEVVRATFVNYMSRLAAGTLTPATLFQAFAVSTTYRNRQAALGCLGQ